MWWFVWLLAIALILSPIDERLYFIEALPGSSVFFHHDVTSRSALEKASTMDERWEFGKCFWFV